MLSLKNLSIKIDSKTILKNITYNFEKGKIYAIMGPNGSGKSTLAYAIMGHPRYEMQDLDSKTKSKIIFKSKDISDVGPDKRVAAGIFLSFQSPLELSGVTVHQLLRLALKGKKDPIEIRKETEKYSKELKINKELLTRSLNNGASGGERKKIEILQSAVLDKEFLIFDEVDTGVDIDGLKTIADFLNKYKRNKTYILITHYYRLLRYLKPDNVIIMKDGAFAKIGDSKLAKKIELEGYKSI